jgi:NDP-sugar pyrophosphorylase family protein
MKAIILAAGYGTRLKPLTDNLPKALVPVAGVPQLQVAIKRCLQEGFDEIGINLHHHADLIKTYLHQHHHFGASITLSQEESILGTGGGIKQLLMQFPATEPVPVINVDVLTDFPLQTLLNNHIHSRATATLAVKKRTTSRYLLFDAENRLHGRMNGTTGETEAIHSTAEETLFPLAFSGIQVIQPEWFLDYPDTSFSSIDCYLAAIRTGRMVKGYRMDSFYWKDMGRLDSLKQAEADIREGRISLPE